MSSPGISKRLSMFSGKTGAGGGRSCACNLARCSNMPSWPIDNICTWAIVCRQNSSDGWLGNLRECLAHLP
jgi:hypothetical protein